MGERKGKGCRNLRNSSNSARPGYQMSDNEEVEKPLAAEPENGGDTRGQDEDQHLVQGDRSDQTVVISQRKLQANRRNALLGGVKTVAGKRNSRRNAMKHGMRATTLLLEQDGGDPESVKAQEARAGLNAEFTPRTFSESLLVEQMVLAVQRMGRGRKFEAAELAMEAPFHYAAVDRVLRYSREANHQFFKALKEFRSLRAEDVGGEEDND
jgi:hypothetical protein